MELHLWSCGFEDVARELLLWSCGRSFDCRVVHGSGAVAVELWLWACGEAGCVVVWLWSCEALVPGLWL